MKVCLIPSILVILLFTATTSSAQRWRSFTDDRFEPRYYHCDKCHHDHEEHTAPHKKETAKDNSKSDETFHCYDAWRKMMKSERKAYRAEEMYYDYRPAAAERKMYKAEKKAWKSHRKEYQHEHENYHEHHYYHDDYYYRDRYR